MTRSLLIVLKNRLRQEKLFRIHAATYVVENSETTNNFFSFSMEHWDHPLDFVRFYFNGNRISVRTAENIQL